MTEQTNVEQTKPSKKEQILLLNQKIEQLEKDLKSAKDMQTYHREAQVKAEKEIEELHTLLDTLPGVIGRKKQEEYYSTPYSLSARFCSWLATRIS